MMPIFRLLPAFPAFFALFLVCSLAAFPAPAAATSGIGPDGAGELRRILEQDGPLRLVLGREIILNADLLPGFYAARGHAPVWVDEHGLNRSAQELLVRLRGAADEGLCPEDYHLDRIDPLVTLAEDSLIYRFPFEAEHLARLDLLLSDAFFLFASHLIHGRIDPLDVVEGWRPRPAQVDLVKLLSYALQAQRLAAVLDELADSHPGVRPLTVQLRRYRELSVAGGWPALPPGEVLRPGGSDLRLPLLRQRLMAGGDWPAGAAVVDPASIRYDPTTKAALAGFQRRHGLDPDGVLGPRTLAELNVSVEDRIRQIEVNLERWRWFPQDSGQRRVEVNIADFRLTVMEKGGEVLSMPVVVGTGYRKTPVFSARLTHLIFGPYWNVPSTILREDKLPKIKADPGFLAKEHYEIVRTQGDELVRVDPFQINWARVNALSFPGTLRQKPGPRNALGRVKFLFPNPFDVYLHDTPDKHLFSRDMRLFSSGCIRIERPVDLACYLLEGQGWGREEVLSAMERSSNRRIDLRSPLPVHILYRTAWVDGEGVLQFRRDIYLRDLDLDLALRRLGAVR